MNNPHRVVVVTGASQGMGAGLVAGYRRLGFGVVATSRSIAPSKDEQVLAIPGDIRDRATAQKVVVAAKERFGRVDTLVNNAGIFIAKPFTEYTQHKVARDRGREEGGRVNAVAPAPPRRRCTHRPRTTFSPRSIP